MVPDLAIEVISESNSAYAVHGEGSRLFAAGVTRVWVVYPDQAEAISFHTPAIQVVGVGQELDGGDLLPAFDSLWRSCSRTIPSDRESFRQAVATS